MKTQPKSKFQLKNPLKKIFKKKLSKKKKILLTLFLIILIVIIAIAVSFSSRRKRMRENIDISFTSETALIERQTLTNSISATGTVESAETKTVNTRMTNMEVTSVYVKEGDYVTEGTVICEFDSSDYEEELAKAKNNYSVNQQINALNGDAQTVYDEAVADVEETLQELREARNNARDEYHAAQEILEEKEAALKEAQAVYDNLNANTASSDEFLAAETALQAAKAEHESAGNYVEKAKSAYEQAQNQREQYQDTYDSTVERAKETYDRAILEEQLITESQEEKTIHEYTELIEDCVVRAGMSGVVTALNVTEGNNFEGGDIYTIQDNEHFIVSSTVDEYDISSIEKGMTAYVKTDATGDAEMIGEVTYVAIAPSNTGGQMGAISSSASYRIEVTIHEPAKNLRAGMTAKLSIALEESKDALTVPYDAVTTGRDGSSTITVDMNGEKKTISVKTGLETDYYTEIISDEISEGMTVYLTTPIAVSGSGDSEDMGFPGGMTMMPGGDMPSGGFSGGGRGGDFSGGSMPGGGMPGGGGPGGF